MNKTKKGIVVFLLAAALLVSVVGTASANSITWDLDQDLTMHDEAHTETGSKAISATGNAIWKADDAAACDVYFPSRTWTGQIYRTTTTGDETFIAYIGYSAGAFTPATGDSGTVTISAGSDHAAFSIVDAGAFTVSDKEWLALKVYSASGVTVKTQGGSYVTWPEDDPAYPYPELSTLVLLSFGLLALAGFVVYSRRRNNKK